MRIPTFADIVASRRYMRKYCAISSNCSLVPYSNCSGGFVGNAENDKADCVDNSYCKPCGICFQLGVSECYVLRAINLIEKKHC